MKTSKRKSAEHLLESIKSSTVFGKKKNVIPKHAEKAAPYRSDEGRAKVPSSKSRILSTAKVDEPVYSGDLELSIGLGYNKGGLQVLMKQEIRDAGKKTSQLENC